jgi:hypothetical protein
MDVDGVFRGQYGLITRRQARDAAMTDRQVDRRLATGAWVREHPRVFRLAAVAPSWESALLGPVLSVGGVASHRAAAALWDLEVFDRPPPELSVPHGRSLRLDGVRQHWTTQWDRRAETSRRSIPCTGLERTLLDAGAVVSFHKLERLCEAAIRKEHTSWVGLIGVLKNHSVQGRTGCGKLRRLLERRLGDRTIPLSDFSRLVAQLLDDHGLPTPELEYRILDDAGDLILQADLAWPALKKAWELDGLQFHFGRAEVERDRRKRNRAKAHGWNIQEILWSMYVDDPRALVALARRFLSR